MIASSHSYKISEVLDSELNFDKIKYLLSLNNDTDIQLLFVKAREIRNKYIGNKVYLRGLIEFSNRCAKNCYYCGLRSGNTHAQRYQMSDDEIVQQAIFARNNNFGSIVLQSGERSDAEFTSRISGLLKKIHQATDNSLRITLSCGEQTEDVYEDWYRSGAQRYLLRIETSNPELYRKIHPDNALHSFDKRKNSLQTLIKTGFQTGTGVMIGLPFQTLDDLANDLIFIKNSGVHMVGMGPYIEHAETPLFAYRNTLLSTEERVNLTLKMIAILRLMMPEINIASTTALQTLDPQGKEKGLLAGANVVMPNITPSAYKKKYTLYERNAKSDETSSHLITSLTQQIESAGCTIAWNETGDPAAFRKK